MEKMIADLNFEKADLAQQLDEIMASSREKETSNIHKTIRISYFLVKVTNPDGKVLTGNLACDLLDVCDAITATGNSFFWNPDGHDGETLCQLWFTEYSPSSTRSLLAMNNNVEYFFVYQCDGFLAVKQDSQINGLDYVLAELEGDDDFILMNDCKIKVIRNL